MRVAVLRHPDRDQLSARWVASVFLRTWPFIRPLLRHLVAYLSASGAVALVTAFLGFLLIGVATSGVLAGKPVGAIAAFIFALDPAVFVEVEALPVEARRALLLPTLELGSAAICRLKWGGRRGGSQGDTHPSLVTRGVAGGHTSFGPA